MGHYSYFELDIEAPFDWESDHTDIIRDFHKQNVHADYAIDEDGDSVQSTKWYEYKKDFVAFSSRYPDIIFIVTRKGEESGDIEKSYFKNGRQWSTKAKIVFDEFDESKLQ